jgi:hypothetical protein
MTYNKPELVTLTSAIRAIQGFDKDIPGHPDQNFPPPNQPLTATVGAYVADE